MKSKNQEWLEEQRARIAPESEETWKKLPEAEKDKIIEREKAKVRNIEVEER